MSDLNGHMDAGTERLLEASLARREQELDRRELAATAAFSAAFLLAAVLFARLGHAERERQLALDRKSVV